jgi:hypothetical protein
MIRVLAVVATFVALNTGGFLAYRALQPEHAAVAPSAPIETISRPAAPIQPKPPQKAPETAPEPAEVHSPKMIVSEPTATDEEDPAAAETPSPTRRLRRPKTVSPSKSKEIESQSSEKAKAPIQNSVMEMDDNPYKRGE